jgi:monoamine oxidase
VFSGGIERADVAIIGAGFAGLIAARELSRRGLDVAVIEGRDRIGGRTWTDTRLGQQLEMGGTWIHPIQPHVWAECMRYGVPTKRSPAATSCGWIVGDECSFGSDRQLDDLLTRCMDHVASQSETLFPDPYEPLAASEQLRDADTRSMAETFADLDLSPDERAVAEGMWATNFSSTIDQGAWTQAVRWCALSGGDWRVMFEAIAKLKFANGSADLLGRIAGDSLSRICLETKVERAEVSERGVTLFHGAGSTEASAAVVTVPVNTLDQIEFEPALSAGRAALAADKQASHGNKIWIRVRGSMEPFFGYAAADHPLTLIQYEYEQDGDSILVAFGSHGETVDGNDRRLVAEAVQPWLPDAKVLDSVEHSWTRDEFSCGTWGVLKPGQLTGCGPDIYRQQPPLFFAGSDIARGWAGFIDGAIETGLRTSTEVIGFLAAESASRDARLGST